MRSPSSNDTALSRFVFIAMGSLALLVHVGDSFSFASSSVSYRIACCRGTSLSATSADEISAPLLFGNLNESLLASLQSKLGIKTPNAIQAEALHAALRGEDVVTLAQTGSGKTLTFLLPMLQRQTIAPSCKHLVLAPNSVLLQQHAYIANQLYPDHTIDFMTPEEFLARDHDMKSDLEYTVVALDEVDAILYGNCDDDALTDEGSQLLATLRSSPATQCLVTTAYLSKAHEQSLIHRDFEGAVVVRDQTQGSMGWLVPTLRQSFQYFSGGKREKLTRVIDDSKNDSFLSRGSTIIFCSSIESSHDLFESLDEISGKVDGDAPMRLLLLHDDMDEGRRRATLDALRVAPGSSQEHHHLTLISTDLAARGLDIPNIRHVILYDVPTDISAFVHQVGRTARKGQTGLVTCLVQTQSNQMGRYTKLHALKDGMQLSFSPPSSTDDISEATRQ